MKVDVKVASGKIWVCYEDKWFALSTDEAFKLAGDLVSSTAEINLNILKEAGL